MSVLGWIPIFAFCEVSPSKMTNAMGLFTIVFLVVQFVLSIATALLSLKLMFEKNWVGAASLRAYPDNP
jgi:hypothetical protein